ncbi:hypothetical protein C4564_04465 [Candidatus Microgenomates bacterium]|nr:MAG: hypothetical protein C4564_04465 [Candidatus Microgenomates bacterium]
MEEWRVLLLKYIHMRERLPDIDTVKYTDKWLAKLYLQYGSVEEALKSHLEPIPYSVAHFHRAINKMGLVRSAGRHVSFPETLHFFREQALAPGTPLESLYKNMPPSFQVSIATLHRIYKLIEENTVRRYASAVLISPEYNPNEVLLANELTGNSRYGKRVGDVCVPMSFSKKNETPRDSVLRVLQHEFSASMAVSGKLSTHSEFVDNIIPKNLNPFMYLNIIDVRVAVYSIRLPLELCNLDACSSFRVTEHRFETLGSVLSEPKNLRLGIVEMVTCYEDLLMGRQSEAPVQQTSLVNLALVKL